MTRRARIALAIGGALLLLAALGLRLVLQPQRLTRTLLDGVGHSLGLEITAAGIGEYHLRGTPRLVVRGVVAREPGATTPLLRADRILLSLPWSTIRARGRVLEATRIELDAPQLDLPALQHWLATRPERETRIPTLSQGLRISNGHIRNNDWLLDDIDLRLRSLAPGKPLDAMVSGRYLDSPTSVRFDVAVAMTHPGNGAGLAVIGPMTIERESWRMPARIRLTGPLRIGDGAMRLTPARVAVSARYLSDAADLPFALGLHGPLQFNGATWSLAPVGVALRGPGAVPEFDARGALALGRRLVLQLEGRMPAWPKAWPPLPTPLGQSDSPLPFDLDYVGKPDLSGIAHLRLQRDATRFDGRFRAFEVLAWVDARDQASVLPPLDAHITTPGIDIAGAHLEGVEITVDEPTLPALEGMP